MSPATAGQTGEIGCIVPVSSQAHNVSCLGTSSPIVIVVMLASSSSHGYPFMTYVHIYISDSPLVEYILLVTCLYGT